MNFDLSVPLILIGLAVLPIALLLAIAMGRFNDER